MARTTKEKQLAVAVATLEKEGYHVMEPNRCICVMHDTKKKNILSTTNFYDAVDGSIFTKAPHGKIPICKSCTDTMYQEYFRISENAKWSIYKMCEKLDIAFINSVYDGTVKEGNASWQKQFGLYMKTFNSFKKNNGWGSFDTSEETDIEFSMSGQMTIKEKDSKWSYQDKRNKKNVVELLGYEVFEGYNENDQKFLYNNILLYLDEETIDDAYKVSSVIQIVDNNNQVRKYQYLINHYSSDINMIMKNSSYLSELENLKKKIVEMNDKIAKENGISAKNKTDKSLNKTSLTGKMKYLKENQFDDLEVDYYSQKTCFGMQRAMEISNNAIRQQFPFDENTFNELLITQRELIQQKDRKILDLEEEVRKLNVELDPNHHRITRGDLDG